VDRRRDEAIAEAIRRRGLPAVFVAGGGYTTQASEMLANSIVAVEGTTSPDG